jgi:hypothetical protein
MAEQRADLSGVIHILGGERRSDDLAGLGIEADVQLPPRPACVGAVPLDQPLALAIDLEMRYGASLREPDVSGPSGCPSQ